LLEAAARTAARHSAPGAAKPFQCIRKRLAPACSMRERHQRDIAPEVVVERDGL